MPKLLHATPKYRLHRASGQAVVTLDGHDHYLGPWKSKSSLAEYDRLTGEWLANGRKLPVTADDGITIVELASRYWDYARGYYVKHGRPTAEQDGIRTALRFLRRGYGPTLASSFGPLALAAIQEKLVEAGHCRKYANETVARIKRCFKWGVRNELVPVTVYQALLTVAGLARGKTKAVDHPPVGPVSLEIFDATLLHMPRELADLLQIQRLTGMRPGEICSIRPSDINTNANVWDYVPREHKMEHLGRQRRILIGPRAQALRRPYLVRPTGSECFLTPRSRKPYTTNSLHQAVQRACDLAFPPPAGFDNQQAINWRRIHRWHPNQLRHSAGTIIRQQFGLEAAQVVLGHSRADVTELYAERDAKLGYVVARQIG